MRLEIFFAWGIGLALMLLGVISNEKGLIDSGVLVFIIAAIYSFLDFLVSVFHWLFGKR
jgi:hypothetical protein